MRVIKQSYEIITPLGPSEVKDMLTRLEEAGRVCYKSEDKIITGVTAEPFLRRIISRGHESVIEHENITVHFITDRGISHELVRHRLASYSQESTRYVCYLDDRVVFIEPSWWNDEKFGEPHCLWNDAMNEAEKYYVRLIQAGWSPQYARTVLPNSLKTEIRTTANLREWRHIFKLRTAKGAHPQMIDLMKPLQIELAQKIPVIFGA